MTERNQIKKTKREGSGAWVANFDVYFTPLPSRSLLLALICCFLGEWRGSGPERRALLAIFRLVALATLVWRFEATLVTLITPTAAAAGASAARYRDAHNHSRHSSAPVARGCNTGPKASIVVLLCLG